MNQRVDGDEWENPIILVQSEVGSSDDFLSLIEIEQKAWGIGGNLKANHQKIHRRLESFPEGITIARIARMAPYGWKDGSFHSVGSQYSFRFQWDGNFVSLKSWDEHTADGWTDRVHRSDGNTGFLVGVGVVPEFRRKLFSHSRRWNTPMRASELLIAVTLDNLFQMGVEQVIGNARIPGYHLHPDMSVEKYCNVRRGDGKLFDPVLRFHKRMGAEILKPIRYSMDDPESLNGGCWVIYRHPFES